MSSFGSKSMYNFSSRLLPFSSIKSARLYFFIDSTARNHGISKATLYNWKSKYSGMDISQVKRLKELEEENRKLKQMYADLALDNKILKDVIEKKL